MKENAKIKVLQVTSGFRKGISGGIPSVLYNYCTSPAFDDDEVGFDYLALGYQTFEPYRAELEKGGGVLYDLGIHVSGMKRNLQIYKNLKKFLKEHKGEYDIVHINSGALVQVLASALAAKSAGIGKVIIHSHNAIVKAKSREIAYKFLKPLFYLCVDEYYACSESAARSVFPRRVVSDHKWTLIPNAIEIDKFKFNIDVRNQYRMEYGLQDKFVIGHVGRFNEQKNHKFIINVFAEVCRQRSDAVLLLVGAGELQNKVSEQAKSLGVLDKVIMVGQRRDANCFMQAMDVLLFPSLYEGLGMVLIEAQVSGLNVISSDRVPINETNVTPCIKYVSIDDYSPWVKLIDEIDTRGRCDMSSSVAARGYELKSAALNLKKLYLNDR